MSSNSIYSHIIYGSLEQLTQKKDEYENDEADSTETTMGGLIMTRHHDLVQNILNKGVSKRTIGKLLGAYCKTGEFDKALECLRRFPQASYYFRLLDFVELICKTGQDREVVNLVLFVENDDEISCIDKILQELWKNGRSSLAQKVITENLKGWKDVYQILHNLQQGRFPTKKEAVRAMEKEFKMPQDGGISWKLQQSRSKNCFVLLSELNKKNAEVPLLESVVLAYEKKRKEGLVPYMPERHEIDDKIRRYHLERGDFRAVERFLKLNGSLKYYKETLIKRKLEYAILKKDQNFHLDSLKAHTKYQKRKIAELRYSDYSEWQKRTWAYGYQAEIQGELAIYEFLYGDPQKAEEHLDAMVDNTEAMVTSVPQVAEAKHKIHIKKHNKIPLKRALKNRFLTSGLFSRLPKKFGWNHAIMSSEKQEQESAERRRMRKMENERSNEEYRASLIKEDVNKMLDYKKLLEEGRIGDVIERMKNSNNENCSDWEIGMLVLDYFPESFSSTFNALIYTRRRYSYHNRSVFNWIVQFFVKGYLLGQVTEIDWKNMVGILRDSQEDEDSKIKKNATVSLIRNVASQGDIQSAWKFFNTFETVSRGMDSDVRSKCLACLLPLSANQESRDGTYLAFQGETLENISDVSTDEKIRYLDAKVDLSLQFGDETAYRSSLSGLQKSLLNSKTPTAAIRAWCSKIAEHHLRNPHQIKNEAQFLLDSPIGALHQTRRRITQTLIALGVPGMEASPEIKRKDNPLRAQHFFFKKLVEKQYLAQNTDVFLGGSDWEIHIPYLRRLLAQHQNEFDTVIETLVSDWTCSKNSAFPVSRWNQAFKVLETVGVLTPGIWSHAKSIDFDTEKLKALQEQVQSEKKKMFRNEPLSASLTSHLQAELIYQAYKPANMSYLGVHQLLNRLSDLSYHLDKYVFPQDGYPVDLSERKEVTLRKGRSKTEELDRMNEFLSDTTAISADKNACQFIARSLCEAGRLKIESFDEAGIGNLLRLFSGYQKESGLDNATRRYQYLQRMKDFLDVYVADNLEREILNFFEVSRAHTSVMWESFVQSLKSDKRKSAIQSQLKIRIPEEPNAEFAANVIAQAILHRSKELQRWKRLVNQEIKNYVNVDGSELKSEGIKLRAFISKNQASFFAKASAGLCTGGDIQSFMRSDHFHINIVDEKKQECVGNLMAYDMKERTGGKNLLLRGFNPNTSLLKEIDVQSYCEAMLKVALQFARDNGFEGVYICDHADFVALSNRFEIARYLTQKYAGIVMETNFPIAESFGQQYYTKKMYPVVEYAPANKTAERVANIVDRHAREFSHMED